MISKDYDTLYELLGELRQEAASLKAEIDYHLKCIREEDAYLQDFIGQEAEDVKVFSPRKMETIYKEEIEKRRAKKTACQKRSQELCDKKAILDGRISRLEDVLSRQGKDSAFQEETKRSLQDASVEGMKELVRRIRESSSYIDRNPVQARQDLAIIAKRLEEIADKVRDMA